MGENSTGFFEEAPGVKSITRIAFFVMIVNALFVVDYQLITTTHIDIAAFLSMVSAACGLKLWSKSIETKVN